MDGARRRNNLAELLQYWMLRQRSSQLVRTMPRHSIRRAIEVIRRMVSDWPGIYGQDRVPR
jgi:hypothetical protein